MWTTTCKRERGRKRKNLDTNLTHFLNINSKRIIHQKCKMQNYNTRKSIKEILSDFGLGNQVLNRTPKASSSSIPREVGSSNTYPSLSFPRGKLRFGIFFTFCFTLNQKEGLQFHARSDQHLCSHWHIGDLRMPVPITTPRQGTEASPLGSPQKCQVIGCIVQLSLLGKSQEQGLIAYLLCAMLGQREVWQMPKHYFKL